MDETDRQLTAQMGNELLTLILAHMQYTLAAEYDLAPATIASIFERMDKSGIVEQLAEVGFALVGEVSMNAETGNSPE